MSYQDIQVGMQSVPSPSEGITSDSTLASLLLRKMNGCAVLDHVKARGGREI